MGTGTGLSLLLPFTDSNGKTDYFIQPTESWAT